MLAAENTHAQDIAEQILWVLAYVGLGALVLFILYAIFDGVRELARHFGVAWLHWTAGLSIIGVLIGVALIPTFWVAVLAGVAGAAVVAFVIVIQD